MKIAKFSRMGFILAAAGSAVGLGNIWKFPYITDKYGGGAFVLIYLITVIAIGFSIMLAEMLIGYLGKQDSVTSFETLAPTNKKFWGLGGFQALTGLFIMTFYSVVIGWIFHYIVTSFTYLPSTLQEAETIFTTMLHTDIYTQLFYHTIAFVVITYVIARGIKSGIEKMNMVLMPALMIILSGMFFYAISLESFSKALYFMFTPDWSQINSEAFVSAVGHAFFTLSIGMAAIMTYSASMKANSNLVKNAFWIVFLDTSIAIVASLVLFTFLYQYGASSTKGPGLVFISLPAVFYQMGVVGNIFSVFFFVALAFAGLTSSVSIVEPMVQYCIDRFSWGRLKASVLIGLIFYIVGIVALLSNINDYKELLSIGDKNIFDWFDYITANIMLPLGGFVIAIFVGFIIKKEKVESLMRPQLGFAFDAWYLSLRYIIPVAIFIVMIALVSGYIE